MGERVCGACSAACRLIAAFTAIPSCCREPLTLGAMVAQPAEASPAPPSAPAAPHHHHAPHREGKLPAFGFWEPWRGSELMGRPLGARSFCGRSIGCFDFGLAVSWPMA